MPTYHYRCSNCGYECEQFQSIKEPALDTCPECTKTTLNRVISGGGGMIFKGSGFYLTDYKNSGTSSQAAPATKPADSAAPPAAPAAAPPAAPASDK